MRTVLRLTLVCSKCGNALECESNPEKTKMLFHSHAQAEAVMGIRPCENCYTEARKPIELLKRALLLADKGTKHS